jgi:prepilin-type N-terminal cleavage/methylation domain-containing protein
MKQRNAGFTLVEVIMAAVIFGILVLIGGSTLGKLAPQFALDNGARTVAMALIRAKVQAITQGRAMDVTFDSNAFSITDSESGNLIAEGHLPSQVQLSGDDTFTFTPLGTATDDRILTVSSAGSSRNIHVGLIGEVQIQ